MQIGLLNHLNFPKSGNPLLNANANAGDDSTTAIAADGSTKPGLGATLRQLTPAQDAPGVILKLQGEDSTTAADGLAKGLVYSNGRKAAAVSDADSDTVRMAEQHSQALQRSAGSSTRLTLDKDGVLVAGVAAADKPADFVSVAVSAMRTYADEQERLKTAAKAGDGASAASLIPRSMAEVQKLASRFRLFA
ncbi:MAG: hypothetical protein HXX19_02790 [Rhodoferax sp.]|nr:hypothetical protein [Rhodoferax sp.]